MATKTVVADLPAEIFDVQVNVPLIHQVVVAQLAAARQGTHSTKTRGEVRGGGRKPYRQKGTGRARQGSIRSPHWRGGGVTFGPTPRSHGGKVNRKVRAQAFRAALRAHADRGSLAVMDPTGWDTPSSKRAAAYLYQAPQAISPRPLLVLVDDPEAVVGLSFRNLEDVYVLAASDVEVVDLMAGRSLLVERAVWERFTGSELSVSEVEAAPKPPPTRTPPPAQKPIARKVEDEKPKIAVELPGDDGAARPRDDVRPDLRQLAFRVVRKSLVQLAGTVGLATEQSLYNLTERTLELEVIRQRAERKGAPQEEASRG